MTEPPGEVCQTVSLMVLLQGVHSKKDNLDHGGAHRSKVCKYLCASENKRTYRQHEGRMMRKAKTKTPKPKDDPLLSEVLRGLIQEHLKE